MRLPAGATELEKGAYYVLARWETEIGVNFVTWYFDDEGEVFFGHYFGNLREALEDFEAREAAEPYKIADREKMGCPTTGDLARIDYLIKHKNA